MSRRSICSMFVGGVAAILLRGASSAAPKKKRAQDGGYKVDFKGYFKGTGTATADTVAGVSIVGEVEDENGKKGMFLATQMIIENDRFKGTGRALGLYLTVTGRVDPPTGTVKVGRITCTYRTDKGRYGRAVGEFTGA